MPALPAPREAVPSPASGAGAPAAARPARVLRRFAALVLALAAIAFAPRLAAQSVEVATLEATRRDGALTLEFALRVNLGKAVEDALARGVPVYFVAEASVYRPRWYWRDDRVARERRAWRIAYQPLSDTWRVSLGALAQSYPSLAEAMAVATRASRWKIADLAAIEGDSRHYVEFSWRLDTSQLPGPMQIGLPGLADWSLGVERTLRLDAP
jgi:hypothetical protein